MCCRAQLHVLANRDRDQKVDGVAIAIIPEPLDNEALRHGPDDVAGIKPGRQGPGDLGGEPGIAGIAPVSVPARRYIEMQVDPQRRPWGDRGEFGYEPRRPGMRVGGRPGRWRPRRWRPRSMPLPRRLGSSTAPRSGFRAWCATGGC